MDMGIAAYNRGTLAIARSIRESQEAMNREYYSRHELPESRPVPPPMQGPTPKPTLGYFPLTENPRMVEVGDRVFCTVSGCKGWSTVTSVKGTRRDLRIKTDSIGRSWGYAHNFTFCPPEWMMK